MTTNNKVIRFHREDQTIKFPWGSSFILLKRPGTSYIAKISMEHILIDQGTGKPVLDENGYQMLNTLALAYDMMHHCIIGWENVRDAETDEEIPFDPDVVDALIERPEHQEFITDLTGHLIELLPKPGKKAGRKQKLKNS